MTLKEARAHALYTRSLLNHGNKKLANYYDPETRRTMYYYQYNLPAKTTCPYASDGCKKFCYAKRDERYTSVRVSRAAALEISKARNFSDRIIYTIETELKSRRFNGNDNVMIVRLHESGDFYNAEYLKKWIAVFNHFQGNKQVVFQFYTKCFRYFVDLTKRDRDIINAGIAAGNIGFSVSRDDSQAADQIKLAAMVRKLYPGANTYYCTDKPESKVEYQEKCECKNCAKCQHCVKTSGQLVYVAIH